LHEVGAQRCQRRASCEWRDQRRECEKEGGAWWWWRLGYQMRHRYRECGLERQSVCFV
ncbi:hypothetical protein LTR28_005273, partial [Elasticomyces elasticus]